MVNTSIDLFCGAGGLTLGLKEAGFKTLLASDFDDKIKETFEKNFPNIRFLCKDISLINFKTLKNSLNLKTGELDLLVGGPPCQGFSMANRKRIEDDPRNLLFNHFAKSVDEFKPKCFLIENVTGLNSENVSISSQVKPVKKAISDYFENIDYAVKFLSFQSEEFGIPQFRRRVLILGTRLENKKYNLIYGKIGNLKGSYKSYEDLKNEDKKQLSFLETKKIDPCTVWQSISDLPEINAGENGNGMKYKSEPSNFYQELMRSESNGVYNHISTPHDEKAMERIKIIKEGENFNQLPENLRTKSVHSGAWGRLEAAGLSPTITTRFDTPSTGRVIHPYKNRTLTVREAARIQSFPDRFIFYGTRTSQGMQVGNAVPPLVSKAIGEMIINDFLI